MSSATPELATDRLMLAPLRVEFAVEMVGVIGDPALYEFTGGAPPTLAELEARYRFQLTGPDSSDEAWHNWVIRRSADGTAVGFVQATVTGPEADLAWVVGTPWQGHGYASEAAMGMCAWLSGSGVGRFTAHIHPDHVASGRVAAGLGLAPTGRIDSEGEAVWSTRVGLGLSDRRASSEE